MTRRSKAATEYKRLEAKMTDEKSGSSTRVITETINSRAQPFMASEQPCKAGKEWENGNLKVSRDHSDALKAYTLKNIW